MKISIVDLEVFYHIGVSDDERALPQRLLLSLEIRTDFSATERTDDISGTIDYFAITNRLLELGKDREWKLLEKLAHDIVNMILTEFKPQKVTVEVKKFIIPQAQYVSVTLTK